MGPEQDVYASQVLCNLASEDWFCKARAGAVL